LIIYLGFLILKSK